MPSFLSYSNCYACGRYNCRTELTVVILRTSWLSTLTFSVVRAEDQKMGDPHLLPADCGTQLLFSINWSVAVHLESYRIQYRLRSIEQIGDKRDLWKDSYRSRFSRLDCPGKVRESISQRASLFGQRSFPQRLTWQHLHQQYPLTPLRPP